MRSDVHSAALRAAAKVAFSVAFIGGCAAHAADVDDPTNANADGTEPGTTAESDLSAKKTKKKTTKSSELPGDCHHADASVPKLSCDQVIAAAFPGEDNYPGTKQKVSAEVQTCCLEALTDRDAGAFGTPHRWECCANLPESATGENIGIACTPWGPPVPPSMKRRPRTAAPRLEAVA